MNNTNSNEVESNSETIEISKLLKLNSVSKLLKSLSLKDAERFKDVVNKAFEENESELRAEEDKVKEKTKAIKEMADGLKGQGIDIKEMLAVIGGGTIGDTPVTTSKPTRKKRPAKYEYQDENGDQKTWTGQGRMPKPIKSALDSNKATLEDYKI